MQTRAKLNVVVLVRVNSLPVLAKKCRFNEAFWIQGRGSFLYGRTVEAAG